ncbi:ABC transporter substrate-binding protein [Dactylosporangium sp. NPDC005572]|uniref:ABC transporter substrate-binding protein n=1 Tax=Dactylosporangium sp. NPDC005572 TaxID=3156889 RepID=UPI0033A0D72A
MSGRLGGLLRGGTALFTAGLLLTAAACGDSAGDTGSSGSSASLPSEIKVVSTNPETGAAAFAGLAANKGYEVAIQEINDQHYLGANTKLVLDKQDTTGKIQTAASQATSAVADKSYTAIFGSVSSQESVAQAPIADKSKMPIIFTQAGSDGVVIGDYTFRVTPPMSSYYPKIADYIKAQHITKLAIIYAAWTPTLKEIGEKTLPGLASQAGFTVVSSIGTQQTTQDFTAPISQALAKQPDGIAILQVGAANPTAMTQLRQAGYKGPVLGNSGASAGNLTPAGANGAGMTWVVDYSSQNKTESSDKFVALYQKKFPSETPLNYAAEAYDAAWLLARGIKEAGSADRTAIMQGMKKTASAGFTGAMGQLKFEGNDLRLPGVVVQWDGTKEILVTG